MVFVSFPIFVVVVVKLGAPSSVLRSTSNLALPPVSSDGVFECALSVLFAAGSNSSVAVGVFPRISSAASVASIPVVDRPIVASICVRRVNLAGLGCEGMIGEILEGKGDVGEP